MALAPDGRSPDDWIVTGPSNSIPRLVERDGEACHYCGSALALRMRDYEWRDGYGFIRDGLSQPVRDHVVPKSRGGSGRLSNLVLSCWECNSAKGARTPDEWLGVSA